MTNTTSFTKENLKMAYWYLYTSNQRDKITVKIITDKAEEYNRGTFYAHFLDIPDLHEQIENEFLPTEEQFANLKEATFTKNSEKILEIFADHEKLLGDKLNFLLGPNGSLFFQIKFKNKLKELFLKYAKLEINEPENILDYKANIICSIFYETICYWYDEGKNKFSVT